jgi:hypothetical protein
LGVIGIAPLTIYGTLAIQRSQRTSVAKMRQGNEHLALAVASLIKEHIDQQRLLTTIGAGILQTTDREQARWAFQLNPDIRTLSRHRCL